jgi:multiple sugar transport system substrate-binding protein
MAHRRLPTKLSSIGLTLAFSLTAWGSAAPWTPAISADNVTLKLVDYWGDEPAKTFYGAAYDACGKQIGATIDVESQPGNFLIQKVLQMASSKTMPDVLMLDNPDMQQIADTGALTPLSDYNVSTDGFYKGILEAGMYQGKIYGLAPAVDTIGLFYNKDILAKAGVTPPTTWDELKAAAKTLTVPGQYGIAFDADPGFQSAWQFLPFMWSNGGDEKTLNSPQVVQALQLWIDLVNSGSASKSVVTWQQSDDNDQFIAGKAAMMINGPWQFPVLEKATGLNYGVVPIPAPKAGMTSIAPLGGEVYTVPQTGNPATMKKAAEFVQCLTTDANEMALAKARNTVPSKSALAAPYTTANPKMAAFVTIVQAARSRTGELGSEWPKAATAIDAAIQSALTGQATAQAALDTAQAALTAP